jgi:molybdenum cofactor cytidylyltransferase
VAALVLAAGRSRRMAPADKLLAPLAGVPVIVRTVDAVLAASLAPVLAAPLAPILAAPLAPVLVVTGDQGPGIAAVLGSRPVVLVSNPEPDAGLSGSLRVGLAALPAACRGVLICLGDMPLVRPDTLAALVAAFESGHGRPGGEEAVWVPVAAGRRGNPVLWGRGWFARLAALRGDRGGRGLLAAHPGAVRELAVADPGVLIDIDTPEALQRQHERLARRAGPG